MKKSGFTLIELLVVMAILGILATIGLSSFRTSQAKSRDAKRKSDLEQVQRALEMYFNDHGRYPTASNGKIVIGVKLLTWGEDEMVDAEAAATVYLKELPKDPSGSLEYCYFSQTAPLGYKLYAKLENSQDPAVAGPYSCGAGTYNYGVSSTNITP